MARMRHQQHILFLSCLILLISLLGQLPSSSCSSSHAATAAPDDFANRCSNELTSMSECFAYATGKTDSPSDKCCGAVSDIRGKNPFCLCSIIKQTYNGSSEGFRGIGLQFSKLVELPTACKLANSSISNCPKLLGIKPFSPDNAIFNGSANSTVSLPRNPSNDGFVIGIGHGGLVATLTSVMLLSVSSLWV